MKNGHGSMMGKLQSSIVKYFDVDLENRVMLRK